jgi:eukaryotic-like serine/threonine-protein kinase
VDCPSCGRANASDLVECSHCEALLVDVFQSNEEKTEPIVAVGTDLSVQDNDDIGSDSGNGFTRFPTDTQYSGDLPRLFRFGNRYQVLEKLGEGGMGRVYKALDLELDRPVALKTIRTEQGKGPEVLKRFKQELVLARKITHKNVVRIYDLGEAEGGVKFFTMELVEGKSLRDLLLEKKTIPTKEAISFMKQMLSGLTEAHSQGIVHRDLKPQNIMVDEAGVLRIMDFGIARTADTATLTGSSEMIGTPDYISPEQVKGENANAQSDLYSAGIVLYELLTGEVPFKGDTAISKVVARLQAKPTPPRTINPQIPPYVERIILKLMEVDPDLRYKTAAEVLQDLEREQVDSSLLLRTRKAVLRKKGWIAAVLAGSVGLGAWVLMKNPSGEVQAAPVTTIAILPFHNMTGNPELGWMENGIQEMLITDISQSSALRPVLRDRVDRILHEVGKDGQSRFDQPALAMISQSAGADYVLHGSFVESKGGRLRMDLILRQSGTGVGTPVKIERASAEVFELVDDLTRKVTSELNLDSFGETDRPLIDLSTRSLPALRAYYQAKDELQKGANQAAIPLLKAAIGHDPRFAMAHAGLAETYFHLGDEANALASITTAKTLAEESPLPLAERYQIHAIAARIQDDPETAVASYRELAKLFPEDPDVLYSLASSLETRGEAGEAVAIYRQVLAISPGHGAALLGLGRMMVVSGHPDEAIPLLREAAESEQFKADDETLGMIHSILGVAHRDLGQYDPAIESFQTSLKHRRAAGDTRGVAISLNNLATVLRRMRRFPEAQQYLDEALAIARQMENEMLESLALLNLGNIEIDNGHLDKALEYHRRSLDIEWDRNEHTELAVRLNMIADTLRKKGLYSDALVYLELAKGYLERSEDLKEKAINLRVLGRIEMTRGNYASAQTALLETLRLFQEIGAGPETAETHLMLARMYADQGRFDDALQAVGSAENLLHEGPGGTKAQARLTRAEILLDVGDAKGASSELDQAEMILDPNTRLERLHLGLLRTRVALSPSTPARSRQRLDELIRETDQPDLRDLNWKARIVLGWALLGQGENKQAVLVLSRVHDEAAQARLRPIQALATLALANAYRSADMLEEAQRYAVELVEVAAFFDGRLLAAQGNLLLGDIAMSNASAEQAEAYDRKATDTAVTILAQVPDSLFATFLEHYPWAKKAAGTPPTEEPAPEAEKKGSP